MLSPTHPNPRHDAAQVGAHGVDTEVLQLAVLVNNQVGGVALHMAHDVVGSAPAGPRCCPTAHGRGPPICFNDRAALTCLQTLHQGVVALAVGGQPGSGLNVVAQGVLGGNATAAAAGAARTQRSDKRRCKEVHEGLNNLHGTVGLRVTSNLLGTKNRA